MFHLAVWSSLILTNTIGLSLCISEGIEMNVMWEFLVFLPKSLIVCVIYISMLKFFCNFSGSLLLPLSNSSADWMAWFLVGLDCIPIRLVVNI